MIPPKGFKNEIYPLRHRVVYAFGLSAVTTTMNSAFATLVRYTEDTNTVLSAVDVNPHNSGFLVETGAVVQEMSIIDKLSLSLKFNMTDLCNDKAHTSGLSGAEVFTGDGINHIHLTWRPIFFSFPEKLDAADELTTVTVKAILGLTKDSGKADVVPLTTNNLPVGGTSDLLQPVSSVNMSDEAYTDYDMTTDLIMEDHPWDEDLFQKALKYYTNKGALRACVGRTRHVHLTKSKPFHNDFVSKFVPRSIRRVVPYTFMGIQVNVPVSSDLGQDYHQLALTASKAHVGCKIICNYHEWNSDHNQDV